MSNWQYPQKQDFQLQQQQQQQQQQHQQQQQQHYPHFTNNQVQQSHVQQVPHYIHQGIPNGNIGPENPYLTANGGGGVGEGSYYPVPSGPSSQAALSPVHLGRPTIGAFLQARSSSSPRSQTGTSTGTYPSPVGPDFRNGSFATPSLPQSNDNEESGNQSTLGPSPLRRGQACQACRRRKLKCDAVRPVCGTCTRSRKAAASANHVSPIPDGDCVYDDGPANSSSTLNQSRGTVAGAAGSGVSNLGPSFSPSNTRRASNASSRQNVSNSVDSSLFEVTGNSRTIQKRRKTVDGGQQNFMLPWNRGNESELNAGTSQGESSVNTIPGETAEERTYRLESRIQHLESILKQFHDNSGNGAASPKPDASPPTRERKREATLGGPAIPIFSMLSPSSGKEEKYRMQYSQRPARYPQGSNLKNEVMDPTSTGMDTKNSSSLFDFDMEGIEINRDEQIRQELLTNGQFGRNDPILQLLWPGWSVDLPSPDTVLTICETFFRLHPMRSLVYKPSFMSGLSLPPKHPHRPHDSLIHAILATTADISPFFGGNQRRDKQDRFVMMLSDSRSRPNDQSPRNIEQLSFKEFHLRKARAKVEYSLITEFRNPLDWIAACLLSCFTLWSEFRITEAYFLSAILCRAASPSGIDKLPSRHFATDESDPKQAPGLFGSPEGIEEHERRITLWHIFIADQYTGGSPAFYENLLSESSIQTHLPCSVADFQAGKDVPPNHQTLSSPDLFRTGHLDDFTLHIKSAILVRRACTLHCRNQHSKKKPTGLGVLDKQVSEMIASFPTFDTINNSSVNDNINNKNKDPMNVDKLVAWSNLSLALFHLHEPYLPSTSITVKDPNSSSASSNYSVGRVNLAIEKVLETIHYLMNSSFDFALLHPQMYVTWSVCGRMLGKDMDFFKRRGVGSEGELQKVMEKLQWIVLGLERGGEKNVKARRCSELVSYVISGTLHESILSQLLYTDGVIPTGDDENNNNSTNPLAMGTNTDIDSSSLDALMMAATSAGSNNGSDQNMSPQSIGLHSQMFPGVGIESNEGTGSQHVLSQQQQGNDAILNFAL